MLHYQRPDMARSHGRALGLWLMFAGLGLGLALLQSAQAFVVVPSATNTKSRRHVTLQQQQTRFTFPVELKTSRDDHLMNKESPNRGLFRLPLLSRRCLQNVWRRFDTLETSGLKETALTSGWTERFNAIHSPRTYLGLAFLALFKFKGLYRNYLYWICIAFLIKWYRARYVFKIPVWDRQPNWNNVITSKDQEKDLKAFTCKNCGSTIFIAKSREFFFEGGTGIGGLGCFTCGAKGKDNFIMDRDRIVEDVGDMDDYFEYERPLDFVSAAEKKKLMREAGGDEEKANQMLLERAAEESEESPPTTDTEAPSADDATGADGASDSSTTEEPPSSVSEDAKIDEEEESSPPLPKVESPSPAPAPKKEKPTPPKPSGNEANLDDLGMDDF